MKKFNLSFFQKSLVYAFFILAILLFVTGLGFMTNIYPLFYNGTTDMFTYFKDVQVFNRAMFKGAIIFIILAVFMIGFDLNKGKAGIFATIYQVFVMYYVYSTTGVVLRAIPHYQGIYEAFDFSEMKDYVPSVFMFDASRILSLAILIVTIVLTLVVIVNLIVTRKNKAGQVNGKGSVVND